MQKTQELLARVSATEARFHARQPDREDKLSRARRTRNAAPAETTERLAMRAARLGVPPARAAEMLDPRVIPTNLAELGFERVLGRNDFVGLPYLEGAQRAARSVGRVVIRAASGGIAGFGTGFLVSPRVIMTNNHVLGDADEAARSTIEFNFQRRLDGSLDRVLSFPLLPADLFLTDPALDFTIVAVAEAAGQDLLSALGFLPLMGAQGKITIDEAVNIIQHPNGEEKQLALRENQVIDLLESFIHYRTDTAPGSSGSPVLNDQWEVVALHHSGVPDRDAQGRILAINGQPWLPQMGEHRVKWKANEGARVSRILARIGSANLPASQRRLLETAAPESTPLTPPAPIPQNGIVTCVDGDQLTMTIPVTVSLRLGALPLRSPEPPPIPVATPAPGESIDDAIEAARQLLRGNEDVIDIRKGWKFRNGWITDERAVVLLVRDKLPESRLAAAGRETLPAEILGFPTDVRPAPPLVRLGREGLAISEIFGIEALKKPRIRYEKPANAATLLEPFREQMQLVAHASPDAGFPELNRFIRRTTGDFRVAMFDFGAPHIIDALVRRLRTNNRKMRITIQPGQSLGGGTKANDIPDADALAKLRAAMNTRFRSGLIRPSTANGYVASSYHIKVAVRDNQEAWLSSGNWQSSNQPNLPSNTVAQKRTLLNKFNREWHIIAKGERIATSLRAFLDHDFETGPAPEDLERITTQLMVELPEDLAFPEAAKEVRLFPPLVIDDEVEAQLALTPDNYSDVALALIESANEKIFFENQSLKILDENDEKFEALVSALLAKQRAGLDVRIIFRDIGDTTAALEAIKDFGFDMTKVKLYSHCHTKGIVVDGKAVLLGSHNWTNHGAVYNRDASVLIKHPDVAAYFETLFLFDWESMSRQRTVFEEFVPRILGPEAAATARGTLVTLEEYLGEQ